MADAAGRTFRWIPLIVVAGLSLAACGDDDGGAPVVTDDAGTSVADAAESVDVAIVSVSDGFAPPTVSVAVGTEVVWTNVDALTHTATADDGSWDSGNLDVGESFSFVPDEPGTFAYICSIHPSMVGELIVE